MLLDVLQCTVHLLKCNFLQVLRKNERLTCMDAYCMCADKMVLITAPSQSGMGCLTVVHCVSLIQ